MERADPPVELLFNPKELFGVKEEKAATFSE